MKPTNGLSDEEIFHEVLHAPKGALILSDDSYLVERDNWYQVVSPSRLDASRNEVILSQLSHDNVNETVDEVISFYRSLGTSFKWCLNPLTRPAGFASVLKSKGFRYWFARGMYCDLTEVHIGSSATVTVEPVTHTNLQQYLSLFIEGWSIDQRMRPLLEEDCKWALSREDGRFHYFIAASNGLPVGTTGFVKKDKSAYLTGGNVLERYRGKGFYKALFFFSGSNFSRRWTCATTINCGGVDIHESGSI